MNHLIFNRTLLMLFLFITLLKLCDAVDTLFPNETIGFGQTLVSQNQVFEVGFFTPGAPAGNSFFGMWYKNTPKVVVWVANRNNPINDPQGVTFAVSGNGSLVVSRGGSIFWSVTPSRVESYPVVHLLDTGNLVVVDDTTKQGYLWQSFDHPTDNWLPGMKLVEDSDNGVETYLTSWKNSDDPSPGEFLFKIDNQGLPDTVTYSGKKKIFRTGKWNGMQFGSYPSFPNSFYKDELDFKGERLISMSRPYNSSIVTRLQLDSFGSLQRYTMNSRKDTWSHAYTFPQDKCDEYDYCGPYTVCSIGKAQRCECFKGFSPVSRKEWDLQDWSSGCRRDTPMNCESGDGFHEVRGVKYPDMLQFWLNMNMNLQECRDECLRNCSCTAYANPYVTNRGSGCVMWLGDLIDVRELPGADTKQNIYIRLPISELGDTTSTDLGKNKEEEKEKEEKETKRRRRALKLTVILVTSGVLFAGLIVGVILLMIRQKRPASKVNNEDLELPLFKFATIMAATEDFSTENSIGEGGFGLVYKGKLSSGEEIAVKRLSTTSKQGTKEFKNEVILIAKLQHRNLVRLLGCCIEGEERMLIYEYLKNKSLNYFVFDQNQRKLLTWPKRFDIITGIARGLLYLHQDSRLKIIHRDLKTSNILLDGDLNPKISDFGLARIFGEAQCIAKTKRVVGTYGYMAPEYAVDGKYSVKSDIFALGVIVLEIVSGKKNRGFDHCDHYHSLLGHAWLLWKENDILELMDECLNDTYLESQVKRCIHVGLLCVQKFAQDRPIMSLVLSMLGTDGAILPKPKEPGFFIERSPSCITSTAQETLTITELEAR